MKKAILAILLILSLVSMLCIGFVLGVLATPAMSQAANLVERIITRNSSTMDDRSGVIVIPRELDKSELLQPGVLILSVITNSPAEQAGLEAGEFIISMDGKAIDSGEKLAAELAKHQPGDEIKLDVQDQDGDRREITIKLGENPQREGKAWLGIGYGNMPSILNEDQMPFSPDENWPQIPTLSPDDMPYFHNWEHPGALIKNVVSGSPADDVGLQAGQLIQAVDGKEVSSTNTLAELIAAYEPGDTVILEVFTPGSDKAGFQEFEVQLGENPDSKGAAWLGVEYSIIDLNIAPDEGSEG